MGDVVRMPRSDEDRKMFAELVRASEAGMTLDDLLLLMAAPFQDASLVQIAADVSEWADNRKPRPADQGGGGRMTPEIIANGCADLIVALEEYEEMIRRDGGVDVATAIDGSRRNTLPHRDPEQPAHWWGSYSAMLRVADGSTALLEQVGEILFIAGVGRPQPEHGGDALRRRGPDDPCDPVPGEARGVSNSWFGPQPRDPRLTFRRIGDLIPRRR